MGMTAHFKFIARTVLVSNNQTDKALRTLNGLLSKEGLLEQFRRTRYYEKPTQKRRRINYERGKSIYQEDMDRRVQFIMRKHRTEPFPANA